MSARIMKVFVVVFWAVMAVWLVLRQPAFSIQTTDDLASMAETAAKEGETWAGIYFRDAATGKLVKIGYSSSEETTTEKGYVITGDSRLRINTQGTQAQVRVASKILTDHDYRLLSLDFRCSPTR
ncbi:MAG: hypothetical protein M5R36_19195 [Deltaproteobacteria bacterium]|nr:hypothetical protein [Deltaproteobacteria bacterium]